MLVWNQILNSFIILQTIKMKRLENQKNLENLKNLKNLDMEENPIFRNINTIDKKKGEVAAALADTLGWWPIWPEVIGEDGVLKIDTLAKALWMEKQLIKLPNGKEIMTFVREPKYLPWVFEIINNSEVKNSLGKNDLVTVNWACPWWLLATITHALHPVNVAVNYPQWWPDATLPVSWFEMNKEWEWKELKFEVKKLEDRTEITFSLDNPNIDASATINSLVAPEVPSWKPVFISWRWPIAILAALSDAYAHKVPFVACFQPWTWNVVAISHSTTDLWTVL